MLRSTAPRLFRCSPATWQRPPRLARPFHLRSFSSAASASASSSLRRPPSIPVYSLGAVCCDLSPLESLVAIGGRDALKFLHNLMTQDLVELTKAASSSAFSSSSASAASSPFSPSISSTSASAYTAWLNQKGRMLFASVVSVFPKTGPSVFPSSSQSLTAGHPQYVVSIPVSQRQALVSHLNHFRMRNAIAIDDLSSTYRTWSLLLPPLAVLPAISPSSSSSSSSSVTSSAPPSFFPSAAKSGSTALDATRQVLKQLRGQSVGTMLDAFVDPRTPLLGFRVLMRAGSTLRVSGVEQVDASIYNTYRILHGIPDSSELSSAVSLPLEWQSAWLRAISFDKGCYLGQELTTRTHHTGIIRKRIVPFYLRPLTDGNTTTATAAAPAVDRYAAEAFRCASMPTDTDSFAVNRLFPYPFLHGQPLPLPTASSSSSSSSSASTATTSSSSSSEDEASTGGVPVVFDTIDQLSRTSTPLTTPTTKQDRDRQAGSLLPSTLLAPPNTSSEGVPTAGLALLRIDPINALYSQPLPGESSAAAAAAAKTDTKVFGVQLKGKWWQLLPYGPAWWPRPAARPTDQNQLNATSAARS